MPATQRKSRMPPGKTAADVLRAKIEELERQILRTVPQDNWSIEPQAAEATVKRERSRPRPQRR